MKKLLMLSLVALWALPQGSTASAGSLIGRWLCDEGTGITVSDSSGNKRNGKFVNGDPAWADGHAGKAIKLVGPTLVEIPSINMTLTEATMAGWLYADGMQPEWAAIIMHRGSGTAHGFNLLNDGHLAYHWMDNGNDWNYRGTAFYPSGEWTHCALTVTPTKATFFVNGAEICSNVVAHPAAVWNQPFHLGGDGGSSWVARRMSNGLLDDVVFMSRALSAEQVAGLMAGTVPVFAKAENPVPATGATGVSATIIQWTPGEGGVYDDVYVGTTPDNMVRVKRQPAMIKMWFQPFDPGQTYYWRIDTVDSKAKVIATGTVWSFTMAPVKAFSPVPADGSKYQDPNGDLNWSPGQYAFTHDVYFSTNKDDVASAAAAASLGSPPLPTQELPLLSRDTTYYWRVDETEATGVKHEGDVWSFTTRPTIEKAAGLVGWWKLEDENAGKAVDYSGWDRDGALYGGPMWVDGSQGGAMEFDGIDDYVDTQITTDMPIWTVSCWVTSPKAPSAVTATGPVHREKNFQINWDHGTAEDRGAAGVCIGGTWYFASFGNLSGNTWYHLAATFDGTALKTFVNGEQVGVNSSAVGVPDSEASPFVFGKHAAAAQFFAGTVDDVRLYDIALTADQVKDTMRGDPLLAWDPRPMSGFTTDIRDAGTLSWSAGEGASSHDVYIGKDKAAVKDAGTGSPEYKGRQANTSFAAAGVVEFGGGTYFWRIDEVEADGTTVHKGNIWSFTVPDFLLVDDFESYSDGVEGRIFQTWIDGWGYTEPEPGNPGNGTSSTVGFTNPPFAETSVFHGGRQAMPFDYNNINQPYYSETDRTWTTAQNWTLNNMNTLSLWFQGYGARYLDDGTTVTVSAAGDDIWNAADAFRFVYKTLNGDGSITAKVNSLVNTDAWAKAGVMIRESLAVGAANTANVVSATSGVSFQWRTLGDGTCSNTGQTGLAAPYWVRLTRTGNTFKAEVSADNKTWSIIGTDPALSSTDVVMFGNVCIGLCVTSHNTNPKIATTAVFSDIKTTGGVSGQWKVADVGMTHPGNDPAQLYVAVQDAAGKTAVVKHPDLNAVMSTTWTEWQIPLTQFTGVNTKTIKKMFIGVGDRTVPQVGGAGRLFIDDIRVIKPVQ